MRTITINGTKLPFRLSYRALKGALSDTGLSIEKMETLSFEHMAVFAKNAINSGYKFDKKDESITLEEVEDLLDSDFSGLAAIGEAIGAEMKIINGEETESVDTEKK